MDAVVTMSFEWWGGNARHAGFGSRGERAPGAKLTEEDVLEIKRMLLQKIRQKGHRRLVRCASADDQPYINQETMVACPIVR